MSKPALQKPNLRFKGFDDEWYLSPISDLIRPTSKKVNLEEGVVYREIGVRSHGRGIFHKEPTNAETIGNKRVFWVHPRAFVVNVVFAWEQAIALTSEREKGMIASHRFPMWLPKEGKAVLEFLYYYFRRKRGKYFLELASPGGAGRNKTLGQDRFGKLKIPFPKLAEQEKIASFLGSVDEKIALLERKRDLLGQYKKGVMQQIFSQEIRFRDHNGNAFPDWEEDEIENRVKRVPTKHDPRKDFSSFPCIELESIEKETGKLLKVFDSIDQKSTKGRFQAGDVLFGKLRPYLRKYACPDFNGVCSSEIWILRAKNDNSNHFLYHLIQSERFSYLCHKTTGSKMPRADWKLVGTSPIKFPVASEQQKISNFLSAIDEKLNLVAQQITLMRDFKKGLLQQMFV